MHVLNDPLFWMGVSLAGAGTFLFLGMWIGRKEERTRMARIGKTRKEYWGEQFTVANNVLRIIMPYTQGDLLNTYSKVYANEMTEKLFGTDFKNEMVEEAEYPPDSN